MCENVVNISQIHKGLVMNLGNDTEQIDTVNLQHPSRFHLLFFFFWLGPSRFLFAQIMRFYQHVNTCKKASTDPLYKRT